MSTALLRFGIVRGLKATSSRPWTPIVNPVVSRYSSSLHQPLLSRQIQLRKPAGFALSVYQKRWTASSVSGKPASENIPQAVQNAKEEAKNLAADVASIISGANYDHRRHSFDGFSEITSGLAQEVPKPILLTGLAGAVPYVGTAISTLYSARAAGLLAAGHAARVDYDTAINVLEAATRLQVTYGAVLLSFLGALHWGMEFSGYGGHQGYKRLFLGVAPVAFAWSTLALDPTMGLIAQWGGFTAMWYADMKATTAGWTPIWYSQYRFYLSILIGSCILITLWGENFFNPIIETTLLAASATNAAGQPSNEADSEGKYSGTSDKIGDIETTEGDDHYVVLKKKAQESEEGEGEEGEGKETDEDDEDSPKETLKKNEEKQADKQEDQTKGKAGEIKQKKY